MIDLDEINKNGNTVNVKFDNKVYQCSVGHIIFDVVPKFVRHGEMKVKFIIDTENVHSPFPIAQPVPPIPDFKYLVLYYVDGEFPTIRKYANADQVLHYLESNGIDPTSVEVFKDAQEVKIKLETKYVIDD